MKLGASVEDLTRLYSFFVFPSGKDEKKNLFGNNSPVKI
jgi:hypothetical protein